MFVPKVRRVLSYCNRVRSEENAAQRRRVHAETQIKPVRGKTLNHEAPPNASSANRPIAGAQHCGKARYQARFSRRQGLASRWVSAADENRLKSKVNRSPTAA